MNAQFAFQYLVRKGLPPHVAAGIVDNLVVESGNFDPAVIAGTRRGDQGTAAYVQQLRGPRLRNFERFAVQTGRAAGDLTAQLDFILEEMNPQSPFADAIAASRRDQIKGATTREQAATDFARYYERPAAQHIAKRINAAQLDLGRTEAETSVAGNNSLLPQPPAPRPVEVASVNPMLPAQSGLDPDLPPRTVATSRMNPLLSSMDGASHMSVSDAPANMADLLAGPYSRAEDTYRMLTGEPMPPINDAIAKEGTSRVRNTPNSMHFQGKALDVSTKDLSDFEQAALYEALQQSGFEGFGFGNTILHADTGDQRAWNYGNSRFAGKPVGEYQRAAAKGIVPADLQVKEARGAPIPEPRPPVAANILPGPPRRLGPRGADGGSDLPMMRGPSSRQGPRRAPVTPAPTQPGTLMAQAAPVLPPPRTVSAPPVITPASTTPAPKMLASAPATPATGPMGSGMSGLGSVFAGIANAVAANQQAKAQIEAEGQRQWLAAHQQTLGDPSAAIQSMPTDMSGTVPTGITPRAVDPMPAPGQSVDEILMALFGASATTNEQMERRRLAMLPAYA